MSRSSRSSVPVGVRLRGVRTASDVVRAAARLDKSATGFLVLGTSTAGLDGSTVASSLARRTTGLGLVVEAAAQRDHPFNIARRTASLDHLTGGRAGWWVLEHDPATELGLGERSSWVDAPPRERAADAVAAVRALWRTWPVESVVGDTASNVFTRAEDIRHADHDGIFRSAGPSTVPTTPQGEPVIFGSDGADARSSDFRSVSVDAVEEHLDSGARGIVVDVDDVDTWTAETLPSLIERGYLRPRQRTSTLRGYLGLGLLTEPDVSTHRPAFT